MLIPKRTKYRKQHRPVRSGMSKGGYNDTMFVGLKYTDVINGRSHAGDRKSTRLNSSHRL